MKPLLVSICLLVFTLTVVAQDNEQPATPKVTLTSATGDVSIRRAGQDDLIEGKAGMALQETDVVLVGFGDSRAVIDFDGASSVTVEPLTELRLSEFKKQDQTYRTRVQMRYGAVVADVKSDVAPSDFRVDTPNSTTAVEGTGFRQVSAPQGDGIRGTQGTFAVLAASGPMWFAMAPGNQGGVGDKGGVTPPGKKNMQQAFGNLFVPGTPDEKQSSYNYPGRRGGVWLFGKFVPGSPKSNLLNQTNRRQALDAIRDTTPTPICPPSRDDGESGGEEETGV